MTRSLLVIDDWYARRKDRKHHREFKKRKADRDVLPHLMPFKLKYNTYDSRLEDRFYIASDRCVCHLMQLVQGEEVFAWPYRAKKGHMGVSWYHEMMEIE